MDNTKIGITVKGNSATDGKDVSMSDFVYAIDNVRKLLTYVADEALGKGHKCDFVISDLLHNSPAYVEITPIALPALYNKKSSGQLIVDLLKKHNKSLLSDKMDNNNLPDEYLEIISKLSSKKGITIKMDDVSTELSASTLPIMETGKQMVDAIKKIKEKETISKTAIIGRLEQVNLHDNNIHVYPQFSQWGKVKVLFQDSDKQQIIDCVDKMVEVGGMGHYRPHSFCPYEIKMEKITQLADGPSDLSQFMGKFPTITGGKSVDEYMRELREEKD